MKCNHCGSEWSANTGPSAAMQNCPFCGKSLLPEKKQLNTVEDVLVEISRSFGIGILTDKRKLIAYFSDLAPQLSKQRKILCYFLDCGGHQRIAAVINASVNEKTACMLQIIREMTDEMFIEETAARLICDAFLFAVSGHRLMADTMPARSENDISAVFAVEPQRTETAELTAQEQFQRGETYYKGTGTVVKDYRRAFAWYQKAAWRDHAMAQYQLGEMYRGGQGTAKDEAAAFSWYKKAADQACVPAQIQVGRAYAGGCGVNKDLNEALAWYHKAADSGNSDAMTIIGECYEQGTGVTKDEAQALAWYEKSARAGGRCGAIAMLMLFARKESMTEAECQSFMRAIGNIDQALEPLLVKSGFYIALEMVRYVSTRTSGVKIVFLSAEQGKADAQMWLAEAYAAGEYLPQDKKQAAYWYQKAADQGNETAKVRLHALTCKELTEPYVIALVKKHHLEDKFLTSAMPAFGKKLRKAINAYAFSAMNERPLLLEDTTLLGSAKEGFVLTDKTLFRNGGVMTGKTSCPIERIQSVFVRRDKVFRVGLEIAPDKSGGMRTTLDVTDTTDQNEADRLEAFWKELLESLHQM